MNSVEIVAAIFSVLDEGPQFLVHAGRTWGIDMAGFSLLVGVFVMLAYVAVLQHLFGVWREGRIGMRRPLLLFIGAFGVSFGAFLVQWSMAFLGATGEAFLWSRTVDNISELLQLVAIMSITGAMIWIVWFYRKRGVTLHEAQR